MAAVAGHASPEPEQLLVMDLNHSDDVKPDVARTLTDLVTARFSDQKAFTTLSGEDIRKLLQIEGEKQVLGCEEGESCLEEIAGALGARFVVYGRISSLGDVLVLQLNLFDAKAGKPLKREVLQANDLGAFATSVETAVHQLAQEMVALLATERAAAKEAEKPAQEQSEPDPHQGEGQAALTTVPTEQAMATTQVATKEHAPAASPKSATPSTATEAAESAPVEPSSSVPESGFQVGPWALIGAGGAGLLVGVLVGIVGALPYWMATQAAAGQRYAGDEAMDASGPQTNESDMDVNSPSSDTEPAQEPDGSAGQQQLWTTVSAVAWVGAGVVGVVSLGVITGGTGWLLLSSGEEE